MTRPPSDGRRRRHGEDCGPRPKPCQELFLIYSNSSPGSVGLLRAAAAPEVKPSTAHEAKERLKAAAEKIVLDANAPGFATVSIRPRFVWGPGSVLIEGLVAAARAGQFAWTDGGRHTTDVTTAAHEVPVPARWFLGQSRILRTDKAVAELDYRPMVSHATGLDAVRNSVAADGA